MRKPPGRTLLFDLDGTLVDPARGIIGACRTALSALGHPAPAFDDLRWIIGPPLRQSFARLLGSGDRVEEALQHYRSSYGAGGLFDAAPYEDIAAVLSALKTDGNRLLVCTAKPRPFALRVVEHFGLLAFFDEVYGAELDGRFDDKGDLIAHIIEREGFAASATCMIGDREHDVVAARRHGISSVGVLWGYGSRDELVTAGATALCERPAVLGDVLARLFAGDDLRPTLS